RGQIEIVAARGALAPAPSAPARYAFAGWALDAATRDLSGPAGRRADLTSSEFDLLLAFMHRPGQAISRAELVRALRGRDWDYLDRSIDTLVARLRKKSDSPDDKDGARRMVGVRPARQRPWRVEDVLDAVDQDRGLRPVGEPEQAFQPEESWPEHRGENGEELREGDRVDRLAAAECESLHAMRAAVCARRRMECRPAGGGEEIRRRQLPRGAVEDGRDGVESPQGGAEFGKARSSLPSRQKVCLRHDEAVGERDLACALRTGGDCRGSVDGVDNRRDSAEREPNGKLRVGDHGVEHGRGLGEPGRLQHDQA